MRLALLCLACISTAHAATLRVTTTADTYDATCDADCSLRDAVAAANAAPEADTIVLKAATYRIQRVTPPPGGEERFGDEDANDTGDLDVAGVLVIKGDPAGPTAIDGAMQSRILEVLAGADVELRDVVLRHGYISELGGAIANFGALRLVRVTARFNRAASGFDLGRGGAVHNAGTLSVADSLFDRNDAGGGEASSGEGGAIYNVGRLHVRATRFLGNWTHDDNDIGGGGAIMNRGGTATIDRAFFRGNATQGQGHGGAIANRAGGATTILNCTITGNFSGEPTQGGGAVANGTRFYGDAGRMSLMYTTVAENNGGGLFNGSGGRLRWFNSIVGGNFQRAYDVTDFHAGNNCVNDGVAFGAGMVIGMDGNCTGNINYPNEETMTRVLYPLHFNGGFAPSYMPRDSTYVIDMAAEHEDVACPATDMRGARRPFDADGDGQARCDIGAFEVQAPLPP